MKKRSTLLTALLAAAQLVACGGSQTNDASVTTDDTSAAEVTNADVFSGLENRSYGGREFNFLIRETEFNYYYIEQESGDVLDDAVYRRNSEVEQRFDININPISIDASWNSRDTYLGTIRNSVMAGSGEYDLIDGYAAVIGGLFTDKICMNLLDVPNLRLDEKWWSALVADELTVNGKLYAMTGDLAINMWSNLHALYFNKSLIKDFGRTSPYERVKNGTWTFDSFLSDIKNVAEDLNGDGIINYDDRCGYIVYDDLAIDNLHNAFNIPVSKKGANGLPEYDLQNEKLINSVERLHNLISDNPDVYYVTQPKSGMLGSSTSREVFSSNNAMYFSDTLTSCIMLRDSSADFGIIPLPKYDENQDGYYTSSRDGRTMFVIPTDVKDAEFAGLITEALAVASHKYVIPAYYDVTLKTKAARDDESSEMLDIIRNGLKLEFVAEYSIQNGGGGYAIRNSLNSEYSSFVASNLSAFNSGLDSFLEAYK